VAPFGRDTAKGVTTVAKIDDVVAAILRRTGSVDTWKLQKLLYYCQAWHLVWEGDPLFRARIEAWANGPVVPAVYRKHRKQFRVSAWPDGDPNALSPAEASSVKAVLDFYAKKPGHELSALTHREPPWKRARRGLAEGERGHNEISLASMAEYYGSL
jgi:uncharacterized phage-associated protein